jgi:hypothetical protein
MCASSAETGLAGAPAAGLPVAAGSVAPVAIMLSPQAAIIASVS